MRIQIKCRVNNLKISKNNNDIKSVGVTICDELRICDSVCGCGLNISNKEPIFFASRNLTIEKVDDYFDFFSAHAREMFFITLEKKLKGKSENNDDYNICKVNNNVYKIVEVELVYG